MKKDKLTTTSTDNDDYYFASKFNDGGGLEGGSDDSGSAYVSDEDGDEIYDYVRDIVPRVDDPSLPVLTFRVWLLGTFFSLILASLNTVLTFRTNFTIFNPFLCVLLSFPLGHALHEILPRDTYTLPWFGEFSLNPGPFNHKEHTLIYVFVSTASKPAYALYNIVGQKYMLGQPLQFFWCVVFTIVSQCFSYGLSGLTTKFLIRPAAMLWPANLSTIALLRSLHEKNDGAKKSANLRRKFFWIAAASMTIYQFFPSFIAPALGAVSLMCFIAPNNQTAKMLGSARSGLGFLSLSFDWSIINTLAPITTPLWALANQFIGMWFIMWIIIPVFWWRNEFGKDQAIGTNPFDGPNGTGMFPLGFVVNSPMLFDKTGAFISPLQLVKLVNETMILNTAVYERVAPIRITTYYAVEYATYFVVFASTLSHVYLWYGQDLWHRFRTSIKDLDANDIHAQLMSVYPEVPVHWYYFLLVLNVLFGLAACIWGGFELPWWGVLLAVALAALTIIPIGTIEAISGQHVGLNIISEMIMGFILPGRITSVMTFKTLSYVGMFQGLGMLEDLKLGHYTKIPPRHMFTVQLVSTIMSSIVNVAVAFIVYERIGVQKMNTDPPLGWTPTGYRQFLSAGAIWGAIGPARFFGPGSPYSKCLYGFLFGALAPVLPWILHKFHPSGPWHLINIPLLAVFPVQVGSTRSDLITPFLVGVLVNHFVQKYRGGWWRRYAYVMSAAFDTGAAIGILLIFFITLSPSYIISMPFWGLNRFDQESCAPDYYNDCMEHMAWGNSFGNTYNQTEDLVCRHFGGRAGLAPR